MIAILVVEEGGIELRLVGNFRPVQIGVPGLGFRLPQLFKLVDLGLRYLTGTNQVAILGDLHRVKRERERDRSVRVNNNQSVDNAQNECIATSSIHICRHSFIKKLHGMVPYYTRKQLTLTNHGRNLRS